MKFEFVRTATSDGLELQGLLGWPTEGSVETCVIHVHGLAGNFYENRFIDDVAETVVAHGLGFLTINTRGHDYISDLIYEEGGCSEYKQIGSIYEIFGDSILDIEAWIELLMERGTKRIILQGHSHGALKATFYVHRTRDRRVVGLILLSPSDDFGCQRERVGERFDKILKTASEMVEKGKGKDLMPAGDFHYPVSALTYMDIFNEDSPLKMFNLSGTDTDRFEELESVNLPTLAIIDTGNEAFVGSPEAYLADIEAHMVNASAFAGHVINGAAHNYLHFEREVAGHIGGWLEREFKR
jgi:pimeloyl-ACP methyl ester carboxylesterase